MARVSKNLREPQIRPGVIPQRDVVGEALNLRQGICVGGNRGVRLSQVILRLGLPEQDRYVVRRERISFEKSIDRLDDTRVLASVVRVRDFLERRALAGHEPRPRHNREQYYEHRGCFDSDKTADQPGLVQGWSPIRVSD